MSTTKKQHYIPQFLLRNFSFNERQQIYVFDKHAEKSRVANIKDIAHENYFYNISTTAGVKSLEPRFSEIESLIAPIINKIISDKSLVSISSDDKDTISLFLIVQYLRTKHQVSIIKDMEEQYIKQTIPLLIESGKIKKPEDIHEETYEQLIKSIDVNVSEDHIKWMILKGLPYLIEKCAPHFVDNMHWVLLETTEDKPFWIGDGAITMYNEKDFYPYGNIGFRCPYIQIFLPLSSTLTLGLLCNLIMQQNNIKLNYVKLDDDNIEFYNHLHVAMSERFLFSRDNNFELSKRLIADNSDFKHGYKAKLLKFTTTVV